jgi:hypothetical protein
MKQCKPARMTLGLGGIVCALALLTTPVSAQVPFPPDSAVGVLIQELVDGRGIKLADMVRRGEVELADGLADLLPPHVRVPERSGKPVTLLDLTTHFSGLPMMPTDLEPANPRNPFADYTTSHVDFLGFHLLDPTVPASVEQQSDKGKRCGSI